MPRDGFAQLIFGNRFIPSVESLEVPEKILLIPPYRLSDVDDDSFSSGIYQWHNPDLMAAILVVLLVDAYSINPHHRLGKALAHPPQSVLTIPRNPERDAADIDNS